MLANMTTDRLTPAVPRAVEHARTALSLPLYPALTDADQQRVLDALAEWRP